MKISTCIFFFIRQYTYLLEKKQKFGVYEFVKMFDLHTIAIYTCMNRYALTCF